MAAMNIKINQNKIMVCPDERISKSMFSIFRHEGWLWSSREQAFMFNRNENGFKRIKRLISYTFLNRYGISEADKEDGKSIVFEFEDENAKKVYDFAIAQMQAAEQAEAEQKQVKKATADENRLAKAKKVIEQLGKFYNDFGQDSYSLSCNNWNLLNAGVRKSIIVKDYCKENNINCSVELLEKKLLQLKIKVRDLGNWMVGKKLVLSLIVGEYEKTDSDSWIRGGSGFYNCELNVANVEKRNIKDYIKLSKIADEQIVKEIVKNYVAYLNGERKQQTYNSVIMSYYQVEEKELEQLLQEKFKA